MGMISTWVTLGGWWGHHTHTPPMCGVQLLSPSLALLLLLQFLLCSLGCWQAKVCSQTNKQQGSSIKVCC